MISLTEQQERVIHDAACELVAAAVMRRRVRLADAALGGAAALIVTGAFDPTLLAVNIPALGPELTLRTDTQTETLRLFDSHTAPVVAQRPVGDGPEQLIYLALEGAPNVAHQGPVSLEGIDTFARAGIGLEV